MLLRSRDRAQRQRALGVKEIAMLPASLDAHSFAGAVAEFAGNGVDRRGVEVDVDIDCASSVERDNLRLYRRHQPGCHQRSAEVVDVRSLELVAALEARDHPDMPR